MEPNIFYIFYYKIRDDYRTSYDPGRGGIGKQNILDGNLAKTPSQSRPL